MCNCNEPLITIIVSMYKGEKYIKDCIESIVQQDYKNIEIILVDDGSPDRCGSIADSYANIDSRIIVIHQVNEGVSASRNHALDKANGDYICVVDQDDILSVNYVNYFYSLIKKYNAEIALTPFADKFFEKPNFTMKSQDRILVLSGSKVAEEMLYHKIIIAPWNKMIKKSLLDDNHVRFNPKFFGGEGFAFSVQAYQYAKKIAIGHQRVYHYRVGDPESGASKFRESMIRSSIDAQKFIKETFVNPTPDLQAAWHFSNWHTYCDCFNVMVGCDARLENNELYIELKKICQRDAFCVLKAPVSFQQKVRGVLFKINPYMAAKIINHFRIRKFKK